MKEKKVLVSIIMPTYNRSSTLSRAIDSCLNQTYNNIEIIVIDDNDPNSDSRKSTEKIMKKYENMKQIKYLKLESNSGSCKARNIGINSASGEYITFLDDDDEYLPNNIEMELDYITSNQLDMIFCDLMIMNDDTGENRIMKYKKNFEFDKESLLRKHLVDIISGGIAFMYKKKVLIEIGGFYDMPASQEYILMLNTILGNYKIGYYEFVGAIGHAHDGDNGITGSEKAIEAKKVVIKLVKPHLHYLKFIDRRKVLFRLYAFIFLSYLRRKNLKFIWYALMLIPYMDLLFKKFISKNKEKNQDNIYYS